MDSLLVAPLNSESDVIAPHQSRDTGLTKLEAGESLLRAFRSSPFRFVTDILHNCRRIRDTKKKNERTKEVEKEIEEEKKYGVRCGSRL